VTVAFLEIVGPAEIYPIVGVNTAYRYSGLNAGPDAVYGMDGDLPAGMNFNGATATISGAPESASGHLEILSLYVEDGDRSVGMEVAISVLPAATVDFPAMTTPQQAGDALPALATLVAELGSVGDATTLEEVDKLIDELNSETSLDEKKSEILIGVDPATGESTIFISVCVGLDSFETRVGNRERPDVPGQATLGRISRGPVSHGDCSRPELVAVHEFELDVFTQAGEQRRAVSGEDRLHNELVLVDQSQIC
jgi:hypothetical protein